MRSSVCSSSFHPAVTRVQLRAPKLLAECVGYAAWAGGGVLHPPDVDAVSVELQLDRQLRRFRRIRPADHPSARGWTQAFDAWEQAADADPLVGARVLSCEEALPVALMRSAARGLMAPGPDHLDNLCATVMLASGCVVSVHRVDLVGLHQDQRSPTSVVVPGPWARPVFSPSGRAFPGDAPSTGCGRFVVCVSGVRGCDFGLAQTLLDVLLRSSASEASGLCWSGQMTIRRPVSAVRWAGLPTHRDRVTCSTSV